MLADEKNLELLHAALRELEAEVIAVPPFEVAYLDGGFAWSRSLRGVVDSTSNHPPGARHRVGPGVEPARPRACEKTQRDRDWPIIRRLLEADYLADVTPSRDKILFWLMESRTPAILGRLCQRYPDEAARIAARRQAVEAALSGDLDRAADFLAQEEAEERRRDTEYWKPLRRELELLRHGTGT